MPKPKSYLVAVLILFTLTSAGCGQKGPLYVDNTPDATAERATPEDEKRRKQLESLEPRNDSRPGITY